MSTTTYTPTFVSIKVISSIHFPIINIPTKNNNNLMGVPITESSNVGIPKLLKNHSLQQESKISVDPISFKDSSFKEGHPSLLLPHLKPEKFLSSSLPSSATSSPRSSSPLKKKWKNKSPKSQPSSPSMKMIDPTTGQQSLALSRLAQLQDINFARSKSCGEGRNTSPNMCTRKLKTKHLRDHVESIDHNCDQDSPREAKHKGEEKFKCGACLFLPGFGKAKLVRSHRSTEEKETINGVGDDDYVIDKYNAKQVSSNRVSLEKFECGSWTSSAIVMDREDGNGIVDMGGFLFDNESPMANSFDLDGVLKEVVVGFERNSNGVNNRKSVESVSRHVKFSNVSPRSNPSSPTTICISPRLRKARDDFNAFLKAQTV